MLSLVCDLMVYAKREWNKQISYERKEGFTEIKLIALNRLICRLFIKAAIAPLI